MASMGPGGLNPVPGHGIDTGACSARFGAPAGARLGERVVELAVSVVVPVKNESSNVTPLIEEIAAALRGREAFEILYIDDGSSDDTGEVLKGLKSRFPELRPLRHAVNCGQSGAIRTGVLHARGALIVTLDGDGQNDPADIPALIDTFRAQAGSGTLGLVAGQRRRRQDTLSKRLASRFANRVRRWALNDATQDTGCGLKLIPRTVFLKLPYFDHMHRFLPALVLREGLQVAFVSVNHRPRLHGQSNYNNLQRALVSISDLLGVMWLKRRCRLPRAVEEL